MQIEKNLNLGFGIGHVKLDAKTMGKENFWKARNILHQGEDLLTFHNYNSTHVCGQRAYVYLQRTCPLQEQSLLNRAKKLGAEVIHTLTPEDTETALHQHKLWIEK